MIKNIILTSANENINAKGILCLETTTSKTIVDLKTYNFSKAFGKFILGLKCGKDYYKVELNGDENYIINKVLDLNQKISAVVVKVENNKSDIMIWGSNETNRVWQNSFLDDFDKKDNDVNATVERDMENKKTIQNANQSEIQNKTVYGEEFEGENDLLNKNIDVEDFSDYETDEEIENIVDMALNKFSEVEDEEAFEEKDFKENKSEFLSSVEEQINELLNNYEEEKALEEIIPSSKFVKVNSSGENFYVFGVIYENEKIKYIVYGIPGEFNVKPEDEYANYYQWLPLNSENPQGYGYYLMYQDAISGNQVEIILD